MHLGLKQLAMFLHFSHVSSKGNRQQTFLGAWLMHMMIWDGVLGGKFVGNVASLSLHFGYYFVFTHTLCMWCLSNINVRDTHEATA